MNLVANAKIGTKLAACSLVVIVLVLGMIVNQKMATSKILDASETVRREQVILDGIMASQLALSDMKAFRSQLGQASNAAEIDDLSSRAKQSSQQAWDALENPISIAMKPDVLNEIRTSVRDFADELDQAAATRRSQIGIDPGLRSPIPAAVSSVRPGAETKAQAAIDQSLTNAHRFTDDAKTKLVDTVKLNDLVGLGVGLGIVLMMVVSGVVLGAIIARPIRLMTTAMNQLAAGDTTVAVPFTDRGDEIGEMATAVATFKQNAVLRERLESEAAERALERERQAAFSDAKAEDLKAFVYNVEVGFDRLASGDLTARMDRAVAPEFEPIRAKFNASVESLETAIGSVIGGVSSIRTGLNQINVASADLSRRTEQQAASLEQTVAALTEVTRGVNDAVSSANQAQGAATTALQNAEKGGSIVSQAIEAMAQIEQSSEKISQIIGVIDEIAFQTNLLALNAGVEAARAGDAGRGFAVVAAEVRALAQRSADAAKQIKELISMSSVQVGAGVNLVSESGKSLKDIVTQVGQMNQAVCEIARNAADQAMSLKEVSIAANQMDKATQQNAAMVEETTAATQSLSAETEQLNSLTEHFLTRQVQSRNTGPVRSAPPPPMPRRDTGATVVQMRPLGSGGAAPRFAPTRKF